MKKAFQQDQVFLFQTFASSASPPEPLRGLGQRVRPAGGSALLLGVLPLLGRCHRRLAVR